MDGIRLLAPAKLNLHLHITGKRADGYHLLESLVVFADDGDVIEIKTAETLGLSVEGEFASALQQHEDNLVVQAAHLLQPYADGQGAQITLTKNLPIGAGLGGGSSDAAATIKGLMQLWDTQLDDAQLQPMLQQLGSDVPVCYAAQPAWVTGAGEQVQPVSLAVPLWVVLCNPRLELSTAEIYGQFAENYTEPVTPPATLDSILAVENFMASTQNMLTPAACAAAPILNTIITAIADTEGCIAARMSGSGATCFGLYPAEELAKQAQQTLQDILPDCWIRMVKVQATS